MNEKFDNLEKIPSELKRLKQWCVYDKYGIRLPNGNSINNEFSVADLEYYDHCISLLKQKKFDGLVFYVTPKNLITFIELKNSSDEETNRKYMEIIRKLGSYSELREDGTSIIICRATINHNLEKDNFKISNNEFIKLSGNQVSMNSDIIDSQSYVAQIFNELIGENFKNFGEKIDISNLEIPENQTDEEILEILEKNDKDQKFQKLWFADIYREYSTKKEASIELLSMIKDASTSKNKTQIERIFNESTLSQELQENVAPLVERLTNKIKKEVEEIEKFPADFVQWPKVQRLYQLAEYVYQSSNRPNKLISLLAAITIPLGFCARNFSITNSSLNAYYLLLGNTGIGKNDLSKARSRIYKAMKPKIGAEMDKFIGNSNFVSGEGLIAHATRKSLCSFSIVSEFSGILKKISRENLTSAENSLKILLLNFYDYGSEQVAGITYSKAKDDVPPIDRPNLTIFAESNPKDVYDNLNEQMISSGLLPRFNIFETQELRQYNNENAENVLIPQDLLKFLVSLAKFCIDCNNSDYVVKINMTDEAKKRSRKLDKITTDEINKDPNNKSIADIYNRVQIKTLKLSALLAIFDAEQDANGDYDFQNLVINESHIDYAENLIMSSSKKIAEKFHRGEIGISKNDERTSFEEIIKCMQEYENLSVDKIKIYKLDVALQRKRIIPYSYILNRCSQKTVFRCNKIGATQAIKNNLKNLIEHEEIIQVPLIEVKKLGNFRGNFYKLKIK